ncbi:MAG: CoB--CoM heterodisulfide reductase iron-sulfur subunit B family protein [candidate division KSB1 bacterium]|nr:CoB--CoM heterodisulfide reductase iron-sulfur subunit B family protein [candidate division KSB1 bacterium]MDZ7293942.1 CoB--CoM heterodisulfide reductase iron-sulfur subunit B family protein [candidate division KSB1 bacterium]MDZ7338674.1 CoB--CoM heterodisulfide reductase iron-sulfur subunit B family protein [candidate division KSB1 bacterium]MDZ7379754.1 CoB--CoM heterodisulfide reductase iron-sulfur subunit B family protein [candidate division KSB1 bacterium]MDZ7385638.1 CoB--CoM heterod
MPALRYIPFFGCMIGVKYPQFEAAVRKTVPALGIELVDVQGFTCCPDPIYFKASDKMAWLSIAARNLTLAEEAGLPIVTMCSGCTATLSEVNHLLTHDGALREKVNERLRRIGREFKGTTSVRHIVTVLRDDVGLDRVAASVTRPLSGVRVAIHYGCHLLKPSKIMRVDDPDRPQILESLVRATGAEPVDHEERLLCCGKACEDEEIPAQMTRDVLASVKALGVDCMGLICPTCFDEYDLGQFKLARKFGTLFELPVVYYFQLLGLAQGKSAQEMGFHRHKVKVEPLLVKIAAQ